MDTDTQRTLLVQAATELTSGGRVLLADLASATGLGEDEVCEAVSELAAENLVEVDDGAVVRVTDAGMAEIEGAG